MATMNISLPEEMKNWVETQVSGGQYANVSDYIRDIIRKQQQEREEYEFKLARLREELDKGEQSGPGTYFSMDEIIEELRSEEKMS